MAGTTGATLKRRDRRGTGWMAGAVLFLLSLMAAAQAQTLVEVDPNADYLHVMSGMVFPPTVANFDRTAVHRFDEFETDVSVGYDRSDIVITVYVYPEMMMAVGGGDPTAGPCT